MLRSPPSFVKAARTCSIGCREAVAIASISASISSSETSMFSASAIFSSSIVARTSSSACTFNSSRAPSQSSSCVARIDAAARSSARATLFKAMIGLLFDKALRHFKLCARRSACALRHRAVDDRTPPSTALPDLRAPSFCRVSTESNSSPRLLAHSSSSFGQFFTAHGSYFGDVFDFLAGQACRVVILGIIDSESSAYRQV